MDDKLEFALEKTPKPKATKKATPPDPYIYIDEKTVNSIFENLMEELLKKPASSKLSFPKNLLGKTDVNIPLHLKSFVGLTKRK